MFDERGMSSYGVSLFVLYHFTSGQLTPKTIHKIFIKFLKPPFLLRDEYKP